MAHCLAFETIPDIRPQKLRRQLDRTFTDLQTSMFQPEPLGYCSQHLNEEGVTALLTANISKCFFEYCRCRNVEDRMYEHVSIMHQSVLNTAAGRGELDMSLFYRFDETDEGFVHNRYKVLFPLLFMEFTKTSYKSIPNKLPQASIYANFMFRLMKYEQYLTWVPLLGIVMTENEMLFRIYSPSVVNSQWLIVKTDVMKCPVSSDGFLRLVHIMFGWTEYCTSFLCSSAAKRPRQLYQHSLWPSRKTIIALDNKMFKCFDYRELSARSEVHQSL